MNKFCDIHLVLESHFVAVSEVDCPCNDNDNSGCITLPECMYSMSKNDLCQANQTLPDGNVNYNINNCPGGSDVFRYNGGKTNFAMSLIT